MTKIKSRAELASLKEQYRGNVLMRLVSDEPEKRREILVSVGECGLKAGARDILKVFFDEVNNAKLEDVSVIAVDCMGSCDLEPTVEIKFPNAPSVRHDKVDAAKAKEIVSGLK